MRLKLFTGLMLAVGFATLIAFPLLLAARPDRSAPRVVKRVWASRMIGLGTTSIIALAAAGVSSLIIIRVARTEYANQSMQNMKGLVEGMRETSRRKATLAPQNEDEA